MQNQFHSRKRTIDKQHYVISEKDKFFIETEQAINTGDQKEQLIKDLELSKRFLKFG